MTTLSSNTLKMPVVQPNAKSSDLQMLGYDQPLLISSPPTPPLDLEEQPPIPINYSDVDLKFELHGMALSTCSNTPNDARITHSTSNNLQALAPIVLLIHGAWHTPAYYFPLQHALTTAGFMTLCPQLPSCTNVLPPPCSLSDDVDMIRDLATDLADRGRPIVAVMHSYGGVVGTEALAGLGWHVRREEKFDKDQDPDASIGGVVALIYMTAFMLPIGFSLATPFGGKLPPFMTEHLNGTCTMNDPYYRFFSTDVTEDQDKTPNIISIPRALPCVASSFLLTHLTNHPTTAQTTSITRAAYLDPGMSTTYLVCEKDVALAPEAQRGMIQMARNNGVVVHEESCDGGHSPFLSVPGDIALVIQRAWFRWTTQREIKSIAPKRVKVNGHLIGSEAVDQKRILTDSAVAQMADSAAHRAGIDEAVNVEGDGVLQVREKTFVEVDSNKLDLAREASSERLQMDNAEGAAISALGQIHISHSDETSGEAREDVQVDHINGTRLAEVKYAQEDKNEAVEEGDAEAVQKDNNEVINEEKAGMIPENNAEVLHDNKNTDVQPSQTELDLDKNTKDHLEPKPERAPPSSIASMLPTTGEKETTFVTSSNRCENDLNHGFNDTVYVLRSPGNTGNAQSILDKSCSFGTEATVPISEPLDFNPGAVSSDSHIVDDGK